jgi:hypothetical protein
MTEPAVCALTVTEVRAKALNKHGINIFFIIIIIYV